MSAMKTCPMCGEQIEASATSCAYCGENLSETPESSRSDYGPYRPSTTLVGWLLALLALHGVLGGIAALSDWSEIGLLTDARSGMNVTLERANANDARQGLIGFTMGAAYLVTVVLFCVWAYRANCNARALGATDMTYTPGWTVGYFFIPILNLFRPYQAIKDVWIRSDPAGRGSVLLGVWWTFWIISGIADQASFRLSMRAESLDLLIRSSYMTLVADLLSIPLAVLAVLVVRGLHRKQQATYERQSAQPASAVT